MQYNVMKVILGSVLGYKIILILADTRAQKRNGFFMHRLNEPCSVNKWMCETCANINVSLTANEKKKEKTISIAKTFTHAKRALRRQRWSLALSLRRLEINLLNYLFSEYTQTHSLLVSQSVSVQRRRRPSYSSGIHLFWLLFAFICW